jgi:hypothetical protein
MIGQHMICHWCRVQDRIALSSGEAELYSSARGLREAIGVKELIDEVIADSNVRIEMEVDASACKGIPIRHGVGQLKHISTKCLWAQEVIKELKIIVRKIPREVNGADALASASNATNLMKHIGSMGGHIETLACSLGWLWNSSGYDEHVGGTRRGGV